MLKDPGAGKPALDRSVIPQEALDRVGGMSPRSSLIITDKSLSSETASGTESVVLLSGEPQGGIKIRRRGPGAEFHFGLHAIAGARTPECERAGAPSAFASTKLPVGVIQITSVIRSLC